MNLLKEKPSNFVYFLVTTVKNEVYILYYKTKNSEISKEEIKNLEDNYLPFNITARIDTKQTKKVVCEDNLVQIDLFNENIIDYIKVRDNIKSCNIINITSWYKLVFESKVIKIMCEKTKEINFDLKDSAIKLDETKFETINKFKLETGTILIEDSVIVECNKFEIIKGKIDVYNKKESNCYINILVKEKLIINDLHLYSTIKATFSNITRDFTEYKDAKLMICYINIFGNEILENDEKYDRILILGFNKASIDIITIEDGVSYGNIIKVDRINIFTINEIHRNINKIKKGNFINIARVADINIHDVYINIHEDSTISHGFKLINILTISDDKLERKLNIYNINIINNSIIEIIICYIGKLKYDKLYFSECKLTKNIKLLEIHKEGYLNKMMFNKCSFLLFNDIKIVGNIGKLNFDECIFNGNYDIVVSAETISMSKCNLKFKNLIFSNKYKSILKFNSNNCIFKGKLMDFPNEDSNALPCDFFDNGSTFNIESIRIKELTPCFNNSILKINKLKLENKHVSKLIETILSPYDKTKDIIIQLNCSLNNSLILTNLDKKLFIKINDIYKENSTNSFDISSLSGKPTIDIESNTPLNMDIENINNDFMFLSLSENYNIDDSPTEINIYNKNKDKMLKLINNNTKTGKLEDEFNEFIGKTTYTITKI